MEQKIINKLALKIAQLEYDKAVLESALEETEAKNKELLEELTKPEEEKENV